MGRRNEKEQTEKSETIVGHVLDSNAWIAICANLHFLCNWRKCT